MKLIVVTLALIVVAFAGVDAKKSQQEDERCAYQWGECQLSNPGAGACGRGTKRGTSAVSGCQPEKTTNCKIPCPKKQGCKYQKGQWSSCDPATSKKTRTDTLVVARSDDSCAQTKNTERACSVNQCVFGEWSQYSACENGRRTKTRAVVSGGSQCEAKATKTKPCAGQNKKKAANPTQG